MAAHYLCELAEQALLQGEAERAQHAAAAGAHASGRSCRAQTCSPPASPSGAGDPAGALMLYLQALEVSPGLALEIIPRGARASRGAPAVRTC